MLNLYALQYQLQCSLAGATALRLTNTMHGYYRYQVLFIDWMGLNAWPTVQTSYVYKYVPRSSVNWQFVTTTKPPKDLPHRQCLDPDLSNKQFYKQIIINGCWHHIMSINITPSSIHIFQYSLDYICWVFKSFQIKVR